MKRKFLPRLAVLGLVFFGLAVWCWAKPPEAASETERRPLAQSPKLTGESLLSGEFMEDFESYTLDQFPLRDGFRSVKASLSLGLFRNLDKDGLYLAEGHVGKLIYPQQEAMLDHSAERFSKLYERYLKDTGSKVYFAIVPDKGAYLAEQAGRLSLDYEAFTEAMREKTDDFMTYVDLSGLLSLDSYYRTDPHWKQETLLPAARYLGETMGIELPGEYRQEALGPFTGAYAGQLALPVEADTLRYLTNETLESCTVTSYAGGFAEEACLYDFSRADGRDPYEFFLSGAQPLLVIENPNAKTDRELILFRDSFGSSLAPLLAEGYAKITLVDIRYVRSEVLGNFLEFTGQDVLFLYSTLLLNDSLALQ